MARPTLWESRASEIQGMLDKGTPIKDIAKRYGIAPESFRVKLGILRRNGLVSYESHTKPRQAPDVDPVSPESTYKSSIEISADGSHKSDRLLRMSAEQAKDVDYLLDAHGYDKSVWELISARSNIYNVYSKIDGIQTLYASKITVKPRVSGRTDEQWESFFEGLAANYQSPVHTSTNYQAGGKLLELNIADLHLDKLAWAGTAGDTYNHEIARERFFYIINNIIDRTKSYGFERILFVWCNDFFHYDGPGKMTTNGTPQDSGMQYEQMFDLGCEMLIAAIDLLEQVAPVTTMYLASNHDRLVSFFATKYLYAWHRNNPNVDVHAGAISRKAIRFGNSLIGFTHGDKEKSRIGDWMQSEYRKDWGETMFHEVHAAHIHSEKKIEEKNGQITRYVSSPTGTDKWHHNEAWVGAIQKAQAFIWDRQYGLEDTKDTFVGDVNRKSIDAIVV